MANKVTGTTDTSGALTTIPRAIGSILVVGTAGEDQTADHAEKEVFSISGTADAVAAFGTGVAQKIVRVLITNGVDNIKGIIIPETGDTPLADALEASLQDHTIRCIVTDNNLADTVTAIKDHLAMAEDNDMFRYAFFGPDAESAKTQDGLIEFAKGCADDRIFISGASLFESDNKTVADPQVVAAGLASAVMTETDDPALPLNNVEINGFGKVCRLVLESERNALANAGITAIYNNENGTPAIWRLVTSDLSTDKIWQEGTTRFIADYVLEKIETMLRANYKRTKNVARILEAIRGDVIVVLEECEALEIIENFDKSTVTVAQNPNDRYGATVDYEFDVVTPLYTITIKQHMIL